MDFEELWAEHKPFILLVGIALIVLLVFQGVKTAIYTDDTGRALASASRSLASLRSEPVAKRSEVAEEREREAELGERLERLRGELTLNVPDDFRLPEVNAKSAFTRVVQETRDKVAEVAGLKNLHVPYELGVPSITPNTREEMDRYLLGLAVVERVVTYAVDEGVRRVESIEIRPARGTGFLRETRVTFRVLTEGRVLGALLDRILDPANPLVLTQFQVTHPPRGEGVVATLGISIVEVDPDRPVGEEGVG
ncbi:MAG: hypothetical protein JXQ29_16085 [Planctomycetes bacterium]|nr:hypothetical protein [Planctomycetota bacterium]